MVEAESPRPIGNRREDIFFGRSGRAAWTMPNPLATESGDAAMPL